MGTLQTKEAIDRHHVFGLEDSYSGNGLHQGSFSTSSGAWVDAPPKFWSSWDYVRAIKLKCNMLPTVGVPYNPPSRGGVKGGCIKTESLSHVLQQCPVTHWKRLVRHDRICTLIKKAAEKRQFSVESEANIRGSDQILKKPDLILTKGRDVYVCDVGVHWEGPNLLEAAYANKVALYSTPPFLDTINKMYKPSSVTVLAFIIGARGTWCPRNVELSSLLGLSKLEETTITADTIKGSTVIHTDFGTRVWRRKKYQTRNRPPERAAPRYPPAP